MTGAHPSTVSAAPDAAGLVELNASAVAHLRAGRPDFALEVFQRVLAIDPDQPDALYLSGTTHMQMGRPEAAIPPLGRAVAVLRETGPAQNLVAAADTLCRCHLAAGAFDAACAALDGVSDGALDTVEARQALAARQFELAEEFLGRGDTPRAIDRFRQVLALVPGEDATRIKLASLLASAQMPAALADFTTEFGADALGPFLFVACMPKSGSSFLKTALVALTGYFEATLTYAFHQNEQELHLPGVLAMARRATVTQQHARATEANLQIMQGFGIRPVVLVRNLADVAVSLCDFYDGGADVNTFFRPVWSGLDRAEKLDAIVDLVMPWYVSFYASWAYASRDARVDIHWLTYAGLTRDKSAALSAVARFYGIEKSAAEIAAAVVAADGNRQGTRFNQGVAGRGAAQLSGGQRDRIARLAAHYRDVDFGLVWP